MKTILVGNCPVHAVTFSEAVDSTLLLARSSSPSFVVTPNLQHISLAGRDHDFGELLASADLCVPDGWPVAWAMRTSNHRRQVRVAGSDLVPAVLTEGSQEGLRIAIVGGFNGVAEAVKQRIEASLPGVRVVLAVEPKLQFEKNDQDWQSLVDDLNLTGPDIVLLGIGAPRQEWIAQRLTAVDGLHRGVVICCGATLDFMAGRQTRAPRLVRVLNLEWAHRLMLDPKRLTSRYITALLDAIRFLVWPRLRSRGALAKGPRDRSIDTSVIHQFDPDATFKAGIEGVVSDLLASRTLGARVRVFGVTARTSWLGSDWRSRVQDHPGYEFTPLANSSKGALPVSLRLAWRLLWVPAEALGSSVHVHRFDYMVALWLKRFQGRTVLWLHTDGDASRGAHSDSAWRWFGAVGSRYEEWSVRRASQVVCFSEREYQKWRLVHDRVTRAYAWADDSAFTEGAPLAERPLQIIWAGRFETPKDPMLAVQVFDLAVKAGLQAQILMVGAGKLMSVIQDELAHRELSGQVVIAGAVSRDRLSQMLKESRVVLSTSRFEGSPRLLIEALASGTPIVGPHEADPDHLLNDIKNGLAVDSRDPEDLAGALMQVFGSPQCYFPTVPVAHQKMRVLQDLRDALTPMDSVGRPE